MASCRNQVSNQKPGRFCLALVVGLLCLALVGCETTENPRLSGDYFEQKPPGPIPELFGDGIVSTGHHEHSSPIYSPDMLHLFYSIADNAQHVILYRHRQEGLWSEPVVAPFSGVYSDDRPVFTPDGKYLYFESKRPLPGVSDSESWRWWKSELTDVGWTEAQLDTVLSAYELSSLMFAPNNDIYFSAVYDDGFGRADIYVTRFTDGHYGEPENLGSAINSTGVDDGPCLAPDGSYLLFSRNYDLYISYSDKKGKWSEPLNLGKPINSPGLEICPIVTPDGKYLFFLSQRGGESHIWWVDAGFIKKLKK